MLILHVVNLRLIMYRAFIAFHIDLNEVRPIDVEVIVFQICWHSINVSLVIIIICIRPHVPLSAWCVSRGLGLRIVSAEFNYRSCIEFDDPGYRQSYINFYKSKIIRVGRHSLSNSSLAFDRPSSNCTWFSRLSLSVENDI